MNYRKHYILYISITFLLFNSCSPKKQNSFSISGKIKGLETNFAILSKADNIQKKTTTFVDSLKVNSLGEFNSVYILEPNIYYLTFGNKTIPLAIDLGQHLVISGNSIEDVKVSGSKDTQLLNNYEKFRIESLDRLVKSVRRSVTTLKKTNYDQSEIADLRELEVENYKKHINELTSYVKDSMGSSIAVYFTSTRWSGNKNLPYLKELVQSFKQNYGGLEISEKLNKKIELLEKTSVGGFISNIEMPNAENKLISLNKIKANYILVDFWASWCPPCRTESVLLNEVYEDFGAKGFKIYGISFDTKKDRWLKALEKDKRIWPEVSTLKGFNSQVSTTYGINALPSNFLIDSTGKILEVNIHGEKLKEKLKSLFESSSSI